MEKGLSRTCLYKIPEFTLQYDPHKEFTMANISRKIYFDKMLNRKDLFHIETKSPEGYDVNYKAIEKKVVSIDFSKSRPRGLLDLSQSHSKSAYSIHSKPFHDSPSINSQIKYL